MKHLVLIVALALALATAERPPTSSAQASTPARAPASHLNDQENARQARALLDQAILALGGGTWLNIRDMQQQGRTYSFYHGQPSGLGALFWRFVEFPDKERLEVTKERDGAYVYTGDKGYEITHKGPHAVEKQDLE